MGWLSWTCEASAKFLSAAVLLSRHKNSQRGDEVKDKRSERSCGVTGTGSQAGLGPLGEREQRVSWHNLLGNGAKSEGL